VRECEYGPRDRVTARLRTALAGGYILPRSDVSSPVKVAYFVPDW
jgi:hypothetical protein